MKPVEYAKELGISRQAVYAKIKRGILTAKNVEGKLYIVVDKVENKDVEKSSQKSTPPTKVVSAISSQSDKKEYDALLQAKDETISILKGTVKNLKKSNKQITTTLRGEIDLLKEAFHEMRTLYVHQLEQQKPHDAIEVFTEDVTEKWIGMKKFFKQYNIVKEKQQEKIIKRIKKAYKNSDERIVKVEGKYKININQTFEDIVK